MFKMWKPLAVYFLKNSLSHFDGIFSHIVYISLFNILNLVCTSEMIAVLWFTALEKNNIVVITLQFFVMHEDQIF